MRVWDSLFHCVLIPTNPPAMSRRRLGIVIEDAPDGADDDNETTPTGSLSRARTQQVRGYIHSSSSSLVRAGQSPEAENAQATASTRHIGRRSGTVPPPPVFDFRDTHATATLSTPYEAQRDTSVPPPSMVLDDPPSLPYHSHLDVIRSLADFLRIKFPEGPVLSYRDERFLGSTKNLSITELQLDESSKLLRIVYLPRMLTLLRASVRTRLSQVPVDAKGEGLDFAVSVNPKHASAGLTPVIHSEKDVEMWVVRMILIPALHLVLALRDGGIPVLQSGEQLSHTGKGSKGLHSSGVDERDEPEDIAQEDALLAQGLAGEGGNSVTDNTARPSSPRVYGPYISSAPAGSSIPDSVVVDVGRQFKAVVEVKSQNVLNARQLAAPTSAQHIIPVLRDILVPHSGHSGGAARAIKFNWPELSNFTPDEWSDTADPQTRILVQVRNPVLSFFCRRPDVLCIDMDSIGYASL